MALTEGNEPSLWHQLFNGAKYRHGASDTFKTTFLNDAIFYHVESVDNFNYFDNLFHCDSQFATKYPNRLKNFKHVVVDDNFKNDDDLVEKIYKIVEKRDFLEVFLVERIDDNCSSYLLLPGKLLLRVENLMLRRVAIVSIFEHFGKNNIKVCLDDSCYDLQEIYNFIVRFQGDDHATIHNFQQLEDFRRWHGDDLCWKYLGDGLLKV